MLGPKEVMMQLEDEALAQFDEKHGREPNKSEMSKIEDQAYQGIGEHYASMIDLARDIAKDRM